MILKQINTNILIDVGSPQPTIFSNDTIVLISFLGTNISSDLEDNVKSEFSLVVAIKFVNYLKYNFGMPGNETIQGHPYYKLGLKSFGFYELEDSDMIESLKNIAKIHPFYDSKIWSDYKHYIITLHDNMFECVAKKMELINNHVTQKQLISEMRKNDLLL